VAVGNEVGVSVGVLVAVFVGVGVPETGVSVLVGRYEVEVGVGVFVGVEKTWPVGVGVVAARREAAYIGARWDGDCSIHRVAAMSESPLPR